MAKFSSTLIEEASGKLGKKLVMRNTAKGQVLAKAPKKASQPRRSEKQANTRFQMSNLLLNYRLYSGKLQEAFEGKGAGLSDANMYVSANYGYHPVYLTRQMRIQGCCVLADNLFSTGSLAPIGYEVNDDGKLVSDLHLGIEITATTTVGEFSAALIQSSVEWEDGDQLTCFIGTQYVGSDGLPRATMKAYKVVLSLDDESKLWDVVSADGFSTIDGYLAGGVVLENMGMAWCHSRNVGSATKVSTQRLVVVSDVIAEYQTYAAMKAAADSYGGINAKAVYLNPTSVGSIVSTSGTTSNPTTSGGGSSPGGGGDASQSTSVAAPVINGNTPFSESTSVTISGPEGAAIYYTVDGSEPTSASTLYSEAITLSGTTTVKAIAVAGGVASEVASKNFTKSSGNDEGGDAE